jgi:hypothetical protein
MRRRLVWVAVLAMVLMLVPVGAAADPAAVVPPVEADAIEGIEVRSQWGDGTRSEAIASPITFSMVGLELPEGVEVGEVHLRTSADGVSWSDWLELDFDPQSGPDPDHEEAGQTGSSHSDLAWVGEADFVQLDVEGGSTEDVVVHVLDGHGLNRTTLGRAVDIARASLRGGGPAVAEASARPAIVSRSGWGADESLRRRGPSYASSLRYSVVHHTATGNSYTQAEAPGIVRSIYRWHTVNNGWNDIGYNALVDRFGTVYEGRYGGLDRAVIGAHAAGFNSGSFGISLIGNMEQVSSVPAAAFDSMVNMIAWKFSIHGVDAHGRTTETAGSGSRFATGQRVTLHTIVGHRDVGNTACPGRALYPRMAEMRDRVKARATGSGGASGSVTTFTDIGGNTHAHAINRIAGAGITEGCRPGRYCPHREVTRAQMASFIFRAMGDLQPVSRQRFSDVPSSNPHFGAINALRDAGIVRGYSDGTFRPQETLNRAQMAVMLREALGLELVWYQRFDDVPMDDPSFNFIRPRINAIHRAGVTNGCTSRRYCPWDGVTRGQMASFLARGFLD